MHFPLFFLCFLSLDFFHHRFSLPFPFFLFLFLNKTYNLIFSTNITQWISNIFPFDTSDEEPKQSFHCVFHFQLGFISASPSCLYCFHFPFQVVHFAQFSIVRGIANDSFRVNSLSLLGPNVISWNPNEIQIISFHFPRPPTTIFLIRERKIAFNLEINVQLYHRYVVTLLFSFILRSFVLFRWELGTEKRNNLRKLLFEFNRNNKK